MPVADTLPRFFWHLMALELSNPNASPRMA